MLLEFVSSLFEFWDHFCFYEVMTENSHLSLCSFSHLTEIPSSYFHLLFSSFFALFVGCCCQCHGELSHLSLTVLGIFDLKALETVKKTHIITVSGLAFWDFHTSVGLQQMCCTRFSLAKYFLKDKMFNMCPMCCKCRCLVG